MSDYALSVIVPVHNSEKTLEVTLNSLLKQTFLSRQIGKMEIFLVDDASTDHSFAIMKQLEEENPEHIRIIKLQENMGPGGARNRALDLAQGEYIGMVDSDDLIDPEMYEKLYLAAITSGGRYDIADCAVYNEADKSSVLYTPLEICGVLDDYRRSMLISNVGYPVSKIYRRQLLEQYHIRFREHVIMEDQDFLSMVYACATSVTVVPEILYYYKDTPGSASKKGVEVSFFENTVQTVKATYERLSGMENYQGIKAGVEYFFWEIFDANLQTIEGYVAVGAINSELAEQMREILKKLILGRTTQSFTENEFVKKKMGQASIQRIQNAIQAGDSNR